MSRFAVRARTLDHVERAAVTACAALGAVSVGLGVGHFDGLPVWELGMAAVLLLALWCIPRIGFEHPIVWFPTLAALYFGFGAQNWVQIVDGPATFRAHVDTNGVLRVPLLGVVAFALGAAVVAGVTRRGRPVAVRASPHMHTAGRILFAAGAIGILYTTGRFGVLLFHANARSHIPGAAELASLCIVPGSLMLAASCARGRTGLLWIGVAVLALSLLAYRTPVLLLVGSFAVYSMGRRAIGGRSFLMVGVVLTMFSLALYNFRLAQSTQVLYGNRVVGTGPLRALPALTPLYYAFAREGTAVFADIERLVPAETPYYDGAAQWQAVETLVPVGGGQTSTGRRRLDSRDLVTELVYGTDTAPTSLTPTIVGGPYMDFGLTGVALELGLFGALAGWLYVRAHRRSSTAADCLVYAYVATLLALSIHTGLLDGVLLLALPAVTFAVYWTTGVAHDRRRL
jgi:hypothetical protein